MSGEEIKVECEQLYQQIRKAEARLEELRSMCGHTETHQGNYSWRVGAVHPAEICTHCGSVIKFL